MSGGRSPDLPFEIPDAEVIEKAESSWRVEVDRRIAIVEAGSADLVSWEEVRCLTREKLMRRFG